jgi:SAM-dependent methyltransferase
MPLVSRIQRLVTQPGLIPMAVLRRLLPRHPAYGHSWIRRSDGLITFRERGFVSAESPSLLLARHHYESTCIREVLDGSKVSRSLEVGCGYGRLTPLFASYSDRHFAIDINNSAVQQARVAYPIYWFCASSAGNLPFPSQSFDRVITWTVLQHVPPGRIQQAIQELRRVLAPGGAILICEETRYAGRKVFRAHTWHRNIEEYASLFAPLTLHISTEITEIDQLPGMESPGRVMLWS